MAVIKQYQTADLENAVLGDNLKQLMHLHHLNEAKLARNTSIPQPTLHKILTGNTVAPKISTLRLLADYFNVTLEELYTSGYSFQIQKTKSQSIPIISWHDCTKSLEYLDTLSLSNCEEWIVIEPLTKYTYGLISKSSMEPQFPKNTILIISPETAAEDGDFVVVHYLDSEEATLRELVLDGPNKLLIPLSQNIGTDKLDDQIKILGVLMQSRFTYHMSK
jgi:SOS-response transcriptional repressor LexA